MTLARQPDFLPTNKLTVAALIGPAFVEVWQAVGPVALTGPAMSSLLGGIVVLLIGRYVPDRANVPLGGPYDG